MPPWLAHLLGLDDTTGRWYLFYSGFGSFMGKLAIIFVLFRHLQCHEPGCLRPARHHMGGYCRKHRKVS
jgi:hypothetical protein